jgi:hypothetical protein
MPKKFYTERDIEDMVSRGQLSLEMADNVVLTELAYEKAERLGLKLLQPYSLPPAAPIRPYLSEPQVSHTGCTECSEKKSADEEQIKQRIRDAVAAKLGNQIDPTLLETIITRVLNNVGVK